MLLAPTHGECCEAFATMLHRLSNLEEPGPVEGVAEPAWQQIHSNGGHKTMRKLLFDFHDIYQGEIEGLVFACNQDFPTHFAVRDMLPPLLELRTHPSLTTIKCLWFSNTVNADPLIAECQRALGERITLTAEYA